MIETTNQDAHGLVRLTRLEAGRGGP